MIGGFCFLFQNMYSNKLNFFFFFLVLGTKPQCRVLKFKDTKREGRVFGWMIPPPKQAAGPTVGIL